MERIYSFNSAYPNLIRVEEPLKKIKFVAVATDSTLSLDGWNSLEGSPFRVNYRLGLKLCEEMLPKVVKRENLEADTSPVFGLKKLIAGRTDIYVDVEPVIRRNLLKEEFAHSPIHQVGVLQEITTHPFLNKKHQDRVPLLAAVLKEMKGEGLFEKYRESIKNQP